MQHQNFQFERKRVLLSSAKAEGVERFSILNTNRQHKQEGPHLHPGNYQAVWWPTYTVHQCSAVWELKPITWFRGSCCQSERLRPGRSHPKGKVMYTCLQTCPNIIGPNYLSASPVTGNMNLFSSIPSVSLIHGHPLYSWEFIHRTWLCTNCVRLTRPDWMDGLTGNVSSTHYISPTDMFTNYICWLTSIPTNYMSLTTCSPTTFPPNSTLSLTPYISRILLLPHETESDWLCQIGLQVDYILWTELHQLYHADY